MKRFLPLSFLALLMSVTFSSCAETPSDQTDETNVLMFAGKPSHGPGAHEHNAGALLLKKCLDESGLSVKTTVIQNGAWATPEQLAAADQTYPDGETPTFPDAMFP